MSAVFPLCGKQDLASLAFVSMWLQMLFNQTLMQNGFPLSMLKLVAIILQQVKILQITFAIFIEFSGVHKLTKAKK